MPDKKNVRGIIAVAVTLAIATGGYLAYRQWQLSTPAGMAETIWKKGYYNANPVNLVNLDKAYLKAWYMAAKDGSAYFTIDNVRYATLGGKKSA